MEALIALVQQAGRAILDVYHDEELMSQVSLKEDASPLTLADQASHAIIFKGLQALTPDIPILSEEGIHIPYEVRKDWECFWCVDPLDGTKEFLRKSDEFTVNIALIQGQEPVLGIIGLPVSQCIYYGAGHIGSWKLMAAQQPVRLSTDKQARQWIAVNSRSHGSPEEQEILGRFPIAKQIVAGSSLKFCFIAEGLAHLYYRHGPTMEWDTAAGHAIVAASGGTLTSPTGDSFLYNKKSLLNSSFLCKA